MFALGRVLLCCLLGWFTLCSCPRVCLAREAEWGFQSPRSFPILSRLPLLHGFRYF
jgi:hypothetical protein